MQVIAWKVDAELVKKSPDFIEHERSLLSP